MEQISIAGGGRFLYSEDMIRVTIKQAAKAKGIKRPTDLAEKTGLSRSRASDLWHGRREPSLKTLDRLCRELGCDLSELLRYVRNGKPT